MARYKPYDLRQDKLIPLSFADQVIPGSFEHTLNEIVEQHLDMTLFEKRYRNEKKGCTAYDPKVLLKIVLYAYSKGIISFSSRVTKSAIVVKCQVACKPLYAVVARRSAAECAPKAFRGRARAWAVPPSCPVRKVDRAAPYRPVPQEEPRVDSGAADP